MWCFLTFFQYCSVGNMIWKLKVCLKQTLSFMLVILISIASLLTLEELIFIIKWFVWLINLFLNTFLHFTPWIQCYYIGWCLFQGNIFLSVVRLCDRDIIILLMLVDIFVIQCWNRFFWKYAFWCGCDCFGWSALLERHIPGYSLGRNCESFYIIQKARI